MGSIIIKHFNKGVESLYGDYELCNEGDIQKTKDVLLERMFGIIRDVAKKDEFWIIKKVNGLCTVGWKAEFPQMLPK